MKKLTHEEILQKINLHKNFLQNIGGGKRLIFKSVDLSDFDFSHLNLQFAQFLFCKLDNCNFRNCELYLASFQGSIGKNINFSHSKCWETNFQNCFLENCNFKAIQFDGINYFEKANLSNCHFDNLNLLFQTDKPLKQSKGGNTT